ncbi:MAG: UDP-3-O-(3-hydroxymyristoyl)glucosamine N-acyltransferase [Flavobacteriaceae bacterium]|nr:UDP-3-O-(3-hydroxymyristoyl)glucosamine N-acyltransferase [Flavobacteriaceae bacterium]MDG1912135.1 UDP-3-O-(3-hydroxymyristoyl)glucosamine N-acyltransferase [Flavobacteriaceae bacterium]
MNLSLKEIATKFKGSIDGENDFRVNQLSKIETAQPGSLSFLAHKKYTPFLYKTKASAILIQKDFVLQSSVDTTLIRVDDPYVAFTTLLMEEAKEKLKPLIGIHESAVIHPLAKLAEDVYVGANVTLGDCVLESGVQIHSNCFVGDQVLIGKNTTLKPNVTVLNESQIGANCTFHSGVILGSDGFGFAPQESGAYLKIPQLGKVVIQDDVEIGANSTIDRATLGETLIKTGVKLDNMVQIAHNVEIGEHTVIAAQTGIAGSTKIGSRCVIGGQVGFAGHLTIGDGVQLQGQTGVTKSIPNAGDFQGTPAMDYRSYYKSYALFKQFPKIEARLRKLEKLINP